MNQPPSVFTEVTEVTIPAGWVFACDSLYWNGYVPFHTRSKFQFLKEEVVSGSSNPIIIHLLAKRTTPLILYAYDYFWKIYPLKK